MTAGSHVAQTSQANDSHARAAGTAGVRWEYKLTLKEAREEYERVITEFLALIATKDREIETLNAVGASYMPVLSFLKLIHCLLLVQTLKELRSSMIGMRNRVAVYAGLMQNGVHLPEVADRLDHLHRQAESANKTDDG